MTRPTPFSVTNVGCRCTYLDSASREPTDPIAFDELAGIFQFEYGEGCTITIAHCPCCGGLAPSSVPVRLYRSITSDEERRLAKLLAPIHSFDDAYDRLGSPDSETATRMEKPESDAGPPEVSHLRSLKYTKLSTQADVIILERVNRNVEWLLQGKYIGP